MAVYRDAHCRYFARLAHDEFLSFDDAAHTVSVSSTQDVAQWYAIDVSSGTPALSQQGRVGAGAKTYVTYPGIDINSAGSIGMSYIRSGTDAGTDYMSM